MPKTFPVFSIENFKHFNPDNDFYADTISTHLKKHHFVTTPHKHDFYLVVLFTKGSGVHEIDFSTYPISPGSLFLMQPGQTHTWKLSKDIEGFIFFHTREFYDSEFTHQRLKDYPFFASIYNSSLFNSKIKQSTILSVFDQIVKESNENNPHKFRKLLSLVNLLYIELSRLHSGASPVKSENYLSKLTHFEDLLSRHYKTVKQPVEYAGFMNITERHLNRITKTSLNKTPSDLILDKIILEAKRILINSNLSITQVAESLGYFDNSYFSRLFKKKTGQSPRQFMLRYKTIA